MPLANVNAPVADRLGGDIVAGYLAHLARTGRGHSHSERIAGSFVRRFPDPQRWADQPLVRRLTEGQQPGRC